MALVYEFVLDGAISLDEIAARVFPGRTERFVPFEDILTADCYQEFGFGLTLRSDRNGYFGALVDGEDWEWEPASYVGVTFRMDKDLDRQIVGPRNMLEIVARLLATGSEDAVLMFNGDSLLLTRFGGVIRKYDRPMWWDDDPDADGLIPG